MASNGFQGSYANDRPPSSTGSGEADIANDPASSTFFMNDYKKHDDLKQMLDSNKDNLKLEAMKRIIGMVAKGRDASDLFPAVVKNVVSKNIEVKKLVYVYLTRYAEEQQDLALLSISTFQRALKDPNQLIRASALRVLSSIRVTMIVPIMMLAIKEAVMDMSPYVRKTAAHAIPKLYSIDPEQKEILLEVIEKLLADKTTLVAGSAIQAFEEVCPERIDLIHKNYRKLCNLIVDVDEWGQVAIINTLTRYCRTQFVNPNQDDVADEHDEKAFYGSSDDSGDDHSRDEDMPKKKPYIMDADHRLLLRSVRPLLNSRNGSVVMAVAQLYHHCAPKSEVNIVAKSLIRLLRNHKEVQYIVLSNIATMSIQRKGMFEPFLKSFYVRSHDPTHIKLLKLEILTNLATETNISTILREFQTYVTSSDQEFAAATIQAIGRCASNISEITDACLNGLVSLLSNRNEAVVGESVVVIKKLLQMQPTEHKEIIQHLAKLADTITVPMARASILWLIGEYSDRVPKIAPDVLRKMAKVFVDEEDIVKLQILNLAAKLCITNSKQTKLLCQYVFNLAKYDQNYDIRDRARFLRQLILPGDKGGVLAKHAKKIFLATKPAPVLQSKYEDRDHYQLGTLSHLINAKAHGYQEIPEWPQESSDPSVRNVEVQQQYTSGDLFTKKKRVEERKKKKSFYSDSEESSPADESSEADSSEEEETSSGSGSESEDTESDSEETSSEEETDSEKSSVGSPVHKRRPDPARKILEAAKAKVAKEVDTGSGSDDTDGSDSSSEEDSSEESEPEPPPVKKSSKKESKKEEKKKSQSTPQKPSDLLLDLDDFEPSISTPVFHFVGPSMNTPVLSPGNLLTPLSATGDATPQEKPKPNYTNVMGMASAPQTQYELLNRITGGGLSIMYRFTRTVSIFSPKMTSVELIFTNNTDQPIEDIKTGDKTLQQGMELQNFPEIASLAPGVSTPCLMGINFNDTTQPAKFTIRTKEKSFPVSITSPVGELLQSNTITETEFLKLKASLAGMNENNGSVTLSEEIDTQTLCKRLYEVANVIHIPAANENELYFASKTAANGSDALVSLKVKDKQISITVNCEKMVIGSMLLKDIKKSLSS